MWSTHPYCLDMRHVLSAAATSFWSRTFSTEWQTRSGRISVALIAAFSYPSRISAGDSPCEYHPASA